MGNGKWVMRHGALGKLPSWRAFKGMFLIIHNLRKNSICRVRIAHKIRTLHIEFDLSICVSPNNPPIAIWSV